MTLPNFLIIGAAKSGTTSLYYYLRQHPDIFMSPVKEPGYFTDAEPDFRGRSARFRAIWMRSYKIKSLREYEGLFDAARSEVAIGEATVSYLPDPTSPGRIYDAIPHARLIAILRNPAERAYSHYLMRRSRDLTRESFETVISRYLDEYEQAIEVHPMLRTGFYYQHLTRYLSLFPLHQIHVCLFDDLVSRANSLIRDIFTFLDVNPEHIVDSSYVHNVSGEPRVRLVEQILNYSLPLRLVIRRMIPPHIAGVYSRISTANTIRPPNALTLELRQRLIAVYRDDTLALQDLLQRDLTHWLQVDRAL